MDNEKKEQHLRAGVINEVLRSERQKKVNELNKWSLLALEVMGSCRRRKD